MREFGIILLLKDYSRYGFNDEINNIRMILGCFETMKNLIRECVLGIDIYEPGKNEEALKKEWEIEGEICKLASNENPLGPSPLAVKAIRKSLQESHLYPDNSCSVLRNKLANSLGFSPENLAVGNGTTELIYLIGIAFLNPGERFIMSHPSFVMAKMVTQMMDACLVEVPLKDYRHDLEAIAKAITEDTKIIYLDNPINPIGTMVTQREIMKFMDKIPDDVLVVLDEAYYEYVNRKDYPDTLQFVKEGRNVIVLRTFSKLYGLAGFRVGYCVSKENFIDAIRRVRPPFSVNRFAQIAAVSAFDDKEHIEKTRATTDSGKKFLYDIFEKMSVFYIPSETNFVTIDVKTETKKIYEEFMKKGVIVRQLTIYGLPTFLRVTIGTPEQNNKFIDVFRQIYAA